MTKVETPSYETQHDTSLNLCVIKNVIDIQIWVNILQMPHFIIKI